MRTPRIEVVRPPTVTADTISKIKITVQIPVLITFMIKNTIGLRLRRARRIISMIVRITQNAQRAIQIGATLRLLAWVRRTGLQKLTYASPFSSRLYHTRYYCSFSAN